MKIQYLSHSAFLCTSENGIRVAIDPFLDGNPAATKKAEQITADYIVLSHAHGDHIGDSFSIARRCGATIIAVFELASYCEEKGLKAHGMHIGGAHDFPFGRVKFTIAQHGSLTPDGRYAGLAAGILLTMDGKTVYHTGDTGLFLDMKLIGERNTVDAMLLPIGGNYTMDIEDAAAAVDFVRPKLAIPMHYNTFPVISADPAVFVDAVESRGLKAKILKIGEEITI